jgi:hypothetical protein
MTLAAIRHASIATVALCAMTLHVLAGASESRLTDAGMPSNCAPFAAKVSASEGSFGSISPVVNGVTCYGAFQFCSAANSPVGGTFGQYNPDWTPSQFLADPSQQVSAWTNYEQNSWAQAQRNGLTSLVGQQVCSGGQCATIDKSSILMACQFGCGSRGKLANYLVGGDCNAGNVKDGAGTSVCSYLVRGAGYDVSCFTGKGNCSIDNVGDFPTGPVPPPTTTSVTS